MRPAVYCLLSVCALAVGPARANGDGSIEARGQTPCYFASPEEAVRTASRLLEAHDWPALARYYGLSGAPTLNSESLRDGSFFLDPRAGPSGPGALTRWRQPFEAGASFVSAKPVESGTALPRHWTVTTMLSIDQGGGMVQRVVRECRLIETREGFQFEPRDIRATQDSPNPGPVKR